MKNDENEVPVLYMNLVVLHFFRSRNELSQLGNTHFNKNVHRISLGHSIKMTLFTSL